jgi:hypothetical protein
MARGSSQRKYAERQKAKTRQTPVQPHSRPFPKVEPTPQSTAEQVPESTVALSYDALNVPILPKLTIGAVGDQYEQEADRVAAQVVQQINAPVPPETVQREDNEEQIQRTPGDEDTEAEVQMQPLLQLKGNGLAGEAAPELEQSIQRERGKGQSLSASLRQPMENAFGADFSGVKIHTDSTADQLNQSIQAKAFTTGQDVFFRQGAYAPDSKSGQELLAHELTHVVQQGGHIQTQSTKTTLQCQYLEEDEQKPHYYGLTSGSDNAAHTSYRNDFDGNSASDSYSYLNLDDHSYLNLDEHSYLNSDSYSDNRYDYDSEEDQYAFYRTGAGADFDNREPAFKYAKVNKRLDSYAGEDQDSREITHVNAIFSALEGAVLRGKVASVAEGLKNQFGWSDQDIEKYYDNKERTQVKYLDEESRKDYELVGGSPIKQGDPPTPFDTSAMFSKHSGNGFGIYVMSPNGELYSHAHKVGLFHHSSFLAGLPTAGAGEIKVDKGVIKHITNKSGHYRPDETNMIQTLEELASRGVNLSNVKLSLVDGTEYDNAQEFLEQHS